MVRSGSLSSDDRLSHKMPHRDYDDKQRRPLLMDPTTVGPSTVWESYHERYKTLSHGTSFSEQRKSEDRWNWRILLPNFIKTSPAALSGAFWHTIYASIIIAPHQIFHQNANVKEMIAANAENLHLPWTELVTYVEPFVQYHDLISNDVLQVYSIYSTAIFLIVSMRLTGAINYQRDGHASYTDLVTEVLKFSQKVQLYCTDKRVAVDLSLWAYATVRTTEMHLQNIHDPKIIGSALETVLLQTRAEIMNKGEHTAQEEKQAAAATELVVQSLLAVENRPLFTLQQITKMCHDAFDRAVITNIRALIDIYASIGSMTGAFQRCVQLQAQPEPYSYNLSMKVFLQLWVAFLPLVIVPSLHLCTIPMSTVLAFFIYKLDEISAEMQNPYGHDASDIALGTINDRLQNDLSQMLLTYDPKNARPRNNNSNAPSTMNFPIEPYTNLENPLGGDWADNEELVKRVGLGNLEENTKNAEK